MLPNRLFLTGAPGSRWSGIAQTLEQMQGFNTSDRTSEREYSHNGFSGHKGAYYGPGMEFDATLDADYLDQAWPDISGTRIMKSHHWAYSLDLVRERFPHDWIMLVYRPSIESYTWWHEAGGWNIKYPDYTWYKDSQTMLFEITKQNQAILEFASTNNLSWNYFNTSWIEKNFDQTVEVKKTWPDILVALLK